MTQRLNIAQYWDLVGDARMRLVIGVANLNHQFVQQVRNGRRHIGRQAALSLIDAARQITPGVEPDCELLLRGVPLTTKRRRSDSRAIPVKLEHIRMKLLNEPIPPPPPLPLSPHAPPMPDIEIPKVDLDSKPFPV